VNCLTLIAVGIAYRTIPFRKSSGNFAASSAIRRAYLVSKPWLAFLCSRQLTRRINRVRPVS
jgi:hypothetical protein